MNFVSFSCEFAPQDNGCSTSYLKGFSASLEFLEPCKSFRIFKCTMLEVLVDELLTHEQLFEYLLISNSYTGPGPTTGDAGILVEAICSHFIQSFSDKQAFGDFLRRLFSRHAMKLECPFRTPALSITTAVSLFAHPIMSSAPKYMQTHLISLVSEALHIKCLKPDRRLTNSFLSTFEMSVILYMRQMPHLHTGDCSVLHWGSTSSSLHEFADSPFEFYMLPETKEKVDNLFSKLDCSDDEVFSGSFSRTKSDLATTSLKFVKDFIIAYDISCEEHSLAILKCLVEKAFESYNDESIQPIEGIVPQNLYLLASLLNLMSISLLQGIPCIRHSDDTSSLRRQKYFSCKEYGFILGIIACFKDLDISSPLQQDLFNLMSGHSKRNIDSRMMFLHFVGLMSLGFVTGLDFLVKACLLVNLALLNLFVFEEGNLDGLHLLVDSSGEYSSSSLPIVRFQEGVSYRSSSLVVASRFHKLRCLYTSVVEYEHNEKESLSSLTASPSHMEGAAFLDEETEKTCSGEIFWKCMLPEDASGFDDLVDFVECKQG